MEKAGEGYLPVFQDAASPQGAVMFGFRAGPAVAVVELPSGAGLQLHVGMTSFAELVRSDEFHVNAVLERVGFRGMDAISP